MYPRILELINTALAFEFGTSTTSTILNFSAVRICFQVVLLQLKL